MLTVTLSQSSLQCRECQAKYSCNYVILCQIDKQNVGAILQPKLRKIETTLNTVLTCKVDGACFCGGEVSANCGLTSGNADS